MLALFSATRPACLPLVWQGTETLQYKTLLHTTALSNESNKIPPMDRWAIIECPYWVSLLGVPTGCPYWEVAVSFFFKNGTGFNSMGLMDWR